MANPIVLSSKSNQAEDSSSSSATVPITFSGLTKPPSSELVSWQETLSAKEQRANIRIGHRVKIRITLPKKEKRGGNHPYLNEWQGGLVTKVLNDIGCVCIQYDDNITHLVWSFPHKLIVVDDDENGKHQVNGDFFAPLSYSESYKSDDKGTSDSSDDTKQRQDLSGGRSMRSRRGARRNYLDLLNPDLQEGKENRLSCQNWEKSTSKIATKRCPPKSVFKSKKEVNMIAAGIQKMTQMSISNKFDNSEVLVTANSLQQSTTTIEVKQEKVGISQQPIQPGAKGENDKKPSRINLKRLRVQINRSKLHSGRSASKSTNDANIIANGNKKVPMNILKNGTESPKFVAAQQLGKAKSKKEKKTATSKNTKKLWNTELRTKTISKKSTSRPKRGTNTLTNAIEKNLKTSTIGMQVQDTPITTLQKPANVRGVKGRGVVAYDNKKAKKSKRTASKRLASKFTLPKKDIKVVASKTAKVAKKPTTKSNVKATAKWRKTAPTGMAQKLPIKSVTAKSISTTLGPTQTSNSTTLLPSIQKQNGKRSRAFGSTHEVRLFAMAFRRTVVM